MSRATSHAYALRALSCGLWLLLSLFVSFAGASRAAAESKETSAKEPAAYRALVQDAVQEFDAGNMVESRSLFLKAHALYPNARTQRGLGMTEFELRNYVSSIGHLEAALASNVRKLEGELRTQTDRLLARARSYVSSLTLTLEPQRARVLVDGKLVSLASGQALLLPVGEHVIEAEAQGYEPERRELSVMNGDDQALHLSLRKSGSASATTAPALGAQASSSTDAPGAAAAAGKKGMGPWLLTGISAAVLVAGAVMVGVGFHDIATVEGAAPGSSWSDVESANARAPVLTGTGFALSAVGVSGLVVGLVWGLRAAPADKQLARRRALASGHF